MVDRLLTFPLTNILKQNSTMKLLLNIVIFQCLVINETVFSKRDSVDALLGKRYQFELFENSEGCGQVYSQEVKVVSELIKLKNKLRRLLYV